jgi:hypothetical protein
MKEPVENKRSHAQMALWGALATVGAIGIGTYNVIRDARNPLSYACFAGAAYIVWFTLRHYRRWKNTP